MNQKHARGTASVTAILVGVTVSLFVLGGILTVAMNHQDGYRKQQGGLNDIKTKSHFLTNYLHAQISQTGYRDLPTNEEMPGISVSFHNGYLAGLEASSDSITYRYIGDGIYMHDCAGALTAAGEISSNQLQINNGVLECNGTTLLSGVDNLQVLYGEDTDDDAIANRYINADFSGLDFTKVVSVRLGLVLISDAASRDIESNQSFNVLGTTITGNDQRLRQPLILTIPIRSLQR